MSEHTFEYRHRSESGAADGDTVASAHCTACRNYVETVPIRVMSPEHLRKEQVQCGDILTQHIPECRPRFH